MSTVFAVTCKDGDVHEFEEHCGLYLADDQALDMAEDLNDDDETCGPHAVYHMNRGARLTRAK